MDRVDCIVIGAGVIGLATARALASQGHEVIVLEAENEIGTHTSSRNSEVIHAGIYYPTGSLKANLCLSGKQMLYAYCRERMISHKQIGKLIVATSADEIETLHQYRTRAIDNGLHDLAWLDVNEVARLEPEVNCVGALLSPSTGIIDTHEFMLSLQGDTEAAGGAIICRSRVSEIMATEDGFILQVAGDEEYTVATRLLVNAAGLWAPTIAASIKALDQNLVPKHYFAKGHYYTLAGKAPFSRLVYPVAGKAGLGIHLTLDLAGQARFGPDVQWVDEINYSFDGARKTEYAAAIKRYYPDIDETRLVEGYTGIRPKLCGPGDQPVDFLIQGPGQHKIRGLVNLYGIESPGLTSSLALADHVAATLTAH
jgi:L-2-hydroxyglutarate oxidase LhgO